ncbi:MAG: hypothetical protein AAGB18_08485 [Pseudomonadota bacterium]
MNSGRLLLEDFSEPLANLALPPPEPSADAAALAAAAEAARAEGYETGYKTGWDDAARAAEEERRSIGEELARNLRDVNFTYFEARDEILVSLRAFLRELIDTMFPALLPEATAANLAEALGDMADEASSSDLALAVSPDDAEAVRTLLPLPGGVDLTIVEEPALAPGQAKLSATDREFSVDAERVVTKLRDGLAPLQTSGRDTQHG